MGYNNTENKREGREMPFLQYKCKNCGNKFEELVQKFDEKVNCPVCGFESQRNYSGDMFSATGTKFKKCSGNCKTCGGCK